VSLKIEKGNMLKNERVFYKLKKGLEMDSPLEPSEEYSSANILILAQ
jgi:hypothetical protein